MRDIDTTGQSPRLRHHELLGEFHLTEAGRLLACNATAAGWLGYASPEEAVGRPHVFGAGDLQMICALGSTPEAAGTRELCWSRPEGGRIWLLLGRCDTSLPAGVLAFSAVDITARKDAEERFHEIFDNGNDIVYIRDLQGNFISLNKVGEALTGYSREEAVGMNLLQLIDPEYRDVTLERMRSQPQDADLSRYELPLISKAGRRFILDISTRMLYRGGQPAGVLGIARDITEQRKLEAELRHAHKMEAVGRLSAGVAHDFNNLLTLITGYSDLVLRKVPPDSPHHAHLVEVRQAGNRAAALTQQLLSFSRREMVSPEILDLNRVVEGSAGMLRRLIGPDIDFGTSLEDALPAVKADPGQLEQVLLNLVVNARDAMPQGGRIMVRTRRVELMTPSAAGVPAGPYVRLSVEDTGAGISAETRSRIFEPFFTTKGDGQGTGLGLATVYSIIKQSKGAIEVASQPGQGTVFTIHLPAVADLPEKPRVETLPPSLPPAWETVLLVEDDASVRVFIRDVLRENGYQVLEAGNAEDALRLAADHPATIHLLVSDVMLPRMRGDLLAETLLLSRPTTRILLISGHIGLGDLAPGSRHVQYLPKPFTSEIVLQSVRSSLNG